MLWVLYLRLLDDLRRVMSFRNVLVWIVVHLRYVLAASDSVSGLLCRVQRRVFMWV